jgi:Carboxylesterase family
MTVAGCILLSFIYALPIIDAKASVVISSNDGDILGYQTNVARAFYGVPYTKPPVGDLRYGKA